MDRHSICEVNYSKILFLYCLFSPKGEWADPGGSAIPGQPVARTEQAPIPWPSCKNQFNIQAPQ